MLDRGVWAEAAGLEAALALLENRAMGLEWSFGAARSAGRRWQRILGADMVRASCLGSRLREGGDLELRAGVVRRKWLVKRCAQRRGAKQTKYILDTIRQQYIKRTERRRGSASVRLLVRMGSKLHPSTSTMLPMAKLGADLDSSPLDSRLRCDMKIYPRQTCQDRLIAPRLCNTRSHRATGGWPGVGQSLIAQPTIPV